MQKIIFTATLGSLLWLAGCGIEQGSSPSILDSTPLSTLSQPMSPFELVLPSTSQAVTALESSVDPTEFALEYGLDVVRVVDGQFGLRVLFQMPAGFDIDTLKSDERVVAADLNRQVNLGVVQNLFLGFVEGGWDPDTAGDQEWIDDLLLPTVHLLSKGEGVLIAEIDTGAYLAHPAISSQVIALGEDDPFVSDEYLDHVDDDGNGVSGEAFGHGTAVATVIAQVAPEAQIIPYRVLTDDGVGSIWDVEEAMWSAIGKGVDIINLSLSFSEESETMEVILKECSSLGIVVVVAAGNNGPTANYPATSNHTWGVASVDFHSCVSAFSGTGVALASFGEGLFVGLPRTASASATGTSFAAPIVTGSVALVMDHFDMAAPDAMTRIQNTASTVRPVDAVHNGLARPASAILFQ